MKMNQLIIDIILQILLKTLINEIKDIYYKILIFLCISKKSI